MACGTPVVCSNVSSMPEVAHGAALLCDPEDPVDIAEKTARCLTDESLRAELVRRGRLRAQDFSWERSADVLMGAFRELAEARR
jgi:glycosyltransferase involved in cell wall biosynthesis